MAVMVGHGAIASALSPFSAAGVVADKILSDMGLAGQQWRIYAWNAAANAVVAWAGYLLFGGWKLFRRAERIVGSEPGPVGPAQSQSASVEGLRFELRHGVTLAVIAALIALVVLGKAQIGLAAMAGAALLSVLRLADERETWQKLPWGVIVMVCGVSVLTSLLEKTGGTQRFAALIGAVSTPQTVTGVVAFVTGIVSVYSSTTGVVLPAFLPMVPDLAAVQAGSDRIALALSVLVGGNLVDLSPLSTIGALCVAGAPPGVDRRALFNRLLAWGFAMSVVGAMLCWVCFGT
jgi:di/tricarboxylate transporter